MHATVVVPRRIPRSLPQAGAVDDHADRPLGGTIDLPPDFHRGIASREGRGIRARKSPVHQA
jgi:hypothetical protein